jgi:hypothetical protein
MHPLAHHAGEDTLLNLLLVGGSWLAAAAVVGRARLAAARNRLARLRRREPQGLEPAMRARDPYQPTDHRHGGLTGSHLGSDVAVVGAHGAAQVTIRSLVALYRMCTAGARTDGDEECRDPR